MENPAKRAGAAHRCAQVEFTRDGKSARRYFIQLAGAGLDARAIELVSWKHKKQVGPLAYVIAGLKGRCWERHPQITVRGDGQRFTGQLMIDRQWSRWYYGGSFAVFPDADLADGFLDVCTVCRAPGIFRRCCAARPSVLFGAGRCRRARCGGCERRNLS